MNAPLVSVILPTYNRAESLRNTVESLLAQDIDSGSVEVIVVNDGSSDGTSEYLRSLTQDGRVRSVEIENSGPYVARNRGAGVARGSILVFADDDCQYPANWLESIARAFRTTGAAAVAGSVVNDSHGHPVSDVYEEMNQFFVQSLNGVPGKAVFVTTNNFACRRNVFEQHGGFDERFYFGAGDREFAARLVMHGERVMFVPEIVAVHRHEFRSLKSFLFHFYRQGRGSSLYYRVVGREKRLGVSRLSARGYLSMLRKVGSGKGAWGNVRALMISTFAQVCIALGYLSASWEGVTDLHQERSERTSSAVAGSRGTMFGLFSFMTGNVVSSAFGFVSFLIIANALPLSGFGIFMVAFSLEAILSLLGNFGLPTSVTRYASEFSKNGDEATAGSVLKTGLLIQLALVSLVGLVFLVVSGLILPRILAVTLTTELYAVVGAAFMVSVCYNYFVSVFSVYLRFLDLAFLRGLVSVTRLALILAVWLVSVSSPIGFVAAFFAPQVLGLAVAFVAFRRTVGQNGEVSTALVPKLLAYGGWQTASGSFSFVTKYVGALILAAYMPEEEVGIYGLGLSLSFVYGVVGATVHTYFLPIGARVHSLQEVLPFVRRTLRLALPVSAVCLLTLLFAEPIVRLLYGAEKTVAVPSFVLLSLPSLVSMTFVAVSVLFHYFFKPYYITVERLFQSMLFIIATLALAQYGATAVAAVSCATSIIGRGFSFVLLSREFRKRGLELKPRMWRTFGFSTEE